MPSTPERIESIEALRAIAALAVLWGHALDYVRVRTDFAHSFAFGADLFFVLSGYIVSLSASRAGTSSGFLLRRAARIVPFYWFATAAELLRLLWRGDRPEWALIFKSFFFLPQEGGPLVAVGWTLSFEVFFYFVLAILIPWRGRSLIAMAALVMTALAFVNPIFVLFALGCLLRPLPLWCGFAGLAIWAGTAWIGLGGIWDCELTIWGANSARRVLYWGLPAFLVVGAAAGLRDRRMPGILLYLGRESYGIYLFQHFGLIVGAKFPLLSGALQPLWLCLTSLVLSLSLSRVASLRSDHVARHDLGVRRVARERG